MLENINHELTYTQSRRVKTSLKYPQFESKHISSGNENQWETRCFGAIIVHGGATGPGFQVGQTITGQTTKKKGIITAIAGNSITYYNYQTNNLFNNGEVISNNVSPTPTTATITTHNTGADHYYDYYTSSVRLQVGLKAGQRTVRRMAMYPPYFSGFEPDIEQTFQLNLKVGVRQRVYVGDDLNGLGLLIEGREVYFFKRSNVSGSPVETDPIHISEWKNGRGIRYDYAQIQKISYKWLGYGAAIMVYVQDGTEILTARYDHVDKTKDVYMRTPSLPACFEIENMTDQTEPTEMRVVCVNHSSEGGIIFPGLEFGVPKIADARERSVASTSGVVLLGLVRLKNQWPTGQPNCKSWRIISHKTTSRSNNAWFELVHIHNLRSVTINGVATAPNSIQWVSFDDSSAMEYYQGSVGSEMTTFDAEHVHTIKPDFIITSTGQNGQSSVNTSEFINAHAYIHHNYEHDNSQLFGIIAKVQAGTAELWWSMDGIEVE